MVKGKKLLAMTLAVTLAAGSTLANIAQADQMSDQVFDESKPHGGAMIADTVIARPIMIGATVIGVGLFVVSLPFALLGGNTGGVFHALVTTPAKTAFLRCVGCTPVQDERMSAEHAAEKAASSGN